MLQRYAFILVDGKGTEKEVYIASLFVIIYKFKANICFSNCSN